MFLLAGTHKTCSQTFILACRRRHADLWQHDICTTRGAYLGLGPLDVREKRRFITFPKAVCDLIKRKTCALFCLSSRNRVQVPYDAFLISWEQRTIVLNSICRTPAVFRQRESESQGNASPNLVITQRSRVYAEADKSERLGAKQQLCDQ